MKQENKQQKINKIINRMSKDQKFRRELTMQSHFYFFQLFFQHFINYPFSWFHKEMFALSEDQSKKIVVIMAFRESGKSTIMNVSFALWSVLGKPQKKFVLIVGGDSKQTKAQFENIKNELRYNKLLIRDMAPFQYENDELGNNSLELKKFGAKIMTVNVKQRIRGMLYRNHRPDLIICDDIEDMISVNNENERNEIYQWFISEILTVGNENTRIMVLGNLLHEKSLLIKLKDEIEKNNILGIFRVYPLLDDDYRIIWPERYTPEKILRFKKTIPDENVWRREYLLKLNRVIEMKICYTKKDIEDSKKEKNKEIKIKKAPSNPKNYCISAPILKSVEFVMSNNKKNQ